MQFVVYTTVFQNPCTISSVAIAAAAARIATDTTDLFDALDLNGTGTVSSAFLTSFLKRDGLLPDDPRLSGLFDYLRSVDGVSKDHPLTLREFADASTNCE